MWHRFGVIHEYVGRVSFWMSRFSAGSRITSFVTQVSVGVRRSSYQYAGLCPGLYVATVLPEHATGIDSAYSFQVPPACCTWLKMLSLLLIAPTAVAKPEVA